jgi:hypothetical protein
MGSASFEGSEPISTEEAAVVMEGRGDLKLVDNLLYNYITSSVSERCIGHSLFSVHQLCLRNTRRGSETSQSPRGITK